MEEVWNHEWLYLAFSLITAIVVLVAGGMAAAKKEKVPGRYQGLFEWAVDALRGMFMAALGPGGEEHLPLIFALFFFILIGNFLGFVPGFKSPTAATNVTIALGLIVFVYSQYIGLRSNGFLGYIKHFAGPIWWLAPLFIIIEVVGEVSKPFSLGMRLFGNIFGEDQIVQQVYAAQGHSIILHLIPMQFIVMILQAFTNCIQAFIFSILACSYIALMSGHHEEGGEHQEAHA